MPSDAAPAGPGPEAATSLVDMVLDGMPTAVFLADPRGRVTRANQEARRLFGVTGDELVGAGVETLFGSGVPVTPWQVLDKLRHGSGPTGTYSFETGVAGPEGRFVPLSVSCSLLRDGDDRVHGALYVARDLSETQQLIGRLEQAEARWRVVAQLGDLLGRQLDPHESLDETCRWLSRSTMASVAIILTAEGVVERVAACPSRSAVAVHLDGLVGRTLDEGSALGRAVHYGEALHAPTLDDHFPLLDHGEGPEGIGSAALVPLAGRNIVVGALLVHTPESGGIRQRALVEQAAERLGLALANSRLRAAVAHFEAGQEAARSREDVMAGVSHDMQTPLAVLLGLLKALEEGGDRLDAKERSQLYERMSRRGLELRRLVQQFLDYSRLGAGRPIPLRQAMTDIRFTIARVEVDLAGRRPVDVHVPVDLPPAYVDADRLDQVLANLMSNAVKFSPRGSPITVAARATDDSIEIDVVDRGQGIRPEDLPTLFDKFHRGADTDSVPGTGLGLYVSRAVLERQGGRLEVSSRLGHGSRFRVTLPRHPPPG